MKPLARALRRAVRKAIKPLRLRFIAWQHYRCEVEVQRFHEMRHDLVNMEVEKRRRQLALAMLHNEIARW